MGTSDKMFNWDEEWNISFAGCGFRSIYYLGALSCILEQVPQLVHEASKICGASSGCLVAAALTVGIPIEQFCADVLTIAKDARKHTLGVFHPTFSLLRTVRNSLQEKLPADAHLRASGRLCVSLTRLADGGNVLVSQFDSREELIQALMCSCFFPVYCGFIPPSYRGVYYMDGALSNNMPLMEQRNTITMAPFSGESDICPREGTFNFFEVNYGNVSIQVNTGNVHRVCTSFLPPTPEKLAEICHNGYMDALHFLRERDLLGTQCFPPGLMTGTDAVKPACCELAKEAAESTKTRLNGPDAHQEDHWWLGLKVIENLPAGIKKEKANSLSSVKPLCGLYSLKWSYGHSLISNVELSSPFRVTFGLFVALIAWSEFWDSHGDDTRRSQLTKFLPVRVLMYLLTLLMLPIELSFLLTKRMILSLLTSTTDLCSSRGDDNRAFQEQHSSSSGSSNSDLSNQTGGDKNIQPLTSTITSNSNKTLHWDNNSNLDHFSLTSTCSSSFPSPDTPAYGKVTLNHSRRTLHQP